jgi:diacylglycerol kinase family enzyme
MLKYFSGVLRKKHLGYSDVYYCKAKEIEISSQVEVFVQADGDLCGRLPAYLSVKKGALTVMLPENS